jgi:hypothetical protein
VQSATDSAITQSVAVVTCHRQTRHEQEPFHLGTGSTDRTEQNCVCRLLLICTFLAPLGRCDSKCVVVQTEWFVDATEMQLRRKCGKHALS